MAAEPHHHAVLLVDDDADTREALRFYLENIGYVVAEAADGNAALTQLRSGLAPCVVILDTRMPGLSGWDVLARMRTAPRLAGIPVVMLSGYPEEAGLAVRLGVRVYLTKPVDLNAIEAVVTEHCRHRDAPG